MANDSDSKKPNRRPETDEEVMERLFSKKVVKKLKEIAHEHRPEEDSDDPPSSA